VRRGVDEVVRVVGALRRGAWRIREVVVYQGSTIDDVGE
jgi:hypothetical protein